VQRGESLTVTSSGPPVALLVSLPAPPPTTDELVARWRNLPPMNLDSLRADLDAALDPGL